jgi:hypothetical protein
MKHAISFRGWLLVAVVLLVGPLVATAQTIYSCTGAPQFYTVPAGVTRLNVAAAGGAGGLGNPDQARSMGGQVQAILAVVPGETLVIEVGEQGQQSGSSSYNGGGAGYAGAGGGGGATDLRRVGASTGDYLTTRNALLVAGGAGGNDWLTWPMPQGGVGGTPDGGHGVGINGTTPGQGATQFAVGAGGPPGVNGQGGSGGYGGGGGGYYGGGAAALNGSAGGGGGGSSWVSPTALVGTPTYSLTSIPTAGWLMLTPVATGVAPLPVQLVGFTAKAQGAAVALAWYTASEVNSDRFDIERSTDGTTFSKLGAVAAQGTTSQAHAYGFRDMALPAGAAVLYYRLRQVDLDGSAHYSPVRAVALAAGAAAWGAEAYPNPWREQLHVQLAGLGAGPVGLVLYDALGKQVLSHTATSGQLVVLPDAGRLPAGVYYLRIKQEGQQQVIKLTH